MEIDLAPRNPYSLILSNPVMIAAGCLGYGIEQLRIASIDPQQRRAVGALVTPTVALHGRRAPARLLEVAGGVISTGEWPGRGLEYIFDRCAAVWDSWAFPVILSIAGRSRQDAVIIARQIEGVAGIAAIELNLSEIEGGVAAISGMIAAIRQATFLPILVKIPLPEATLLRQIPAMAQAGADALVACAPPKVLAGAQASGNPTAGYLCGPGWQPLARYALQQVLEVAQPLGLPVVASGGITTITDLRAALAMGAHAAQIGSALLAEPGLAASLAQQALDGGDQIA
ncbi:MAG: dihydroorotate dehydrogenase [Roseiflexaceae bacterium]